jgi:hypothetical protein
VNHVIFTGQSNSVANGGTPVITTTQPYTNLRFDTGPMSMAGCGGDGCPPGGYEKPAAFAPLIEGDTFMYPVETPCSGLANEASKLALTTYGFGGAGKPAKHDVLVTMDGRSGFTYWCLRKGGCNYHLDQLIPYSQSMQEIKDAMALAAAAGKSYVVRAVCAVHGESDHYSYTTTSSEFPNVSSDGTGIIHDYKEALFEWQRDYENDVRALTGQKQRVPLLISQLYGWNDVPYSKLAQLQLDAHIESLGKVVMIGPGYFLPGVTDCKHYTNEGYRRLGEYFGKVYAKVVLGGETWEPVRPKLVARAGNVVTVKYFVPSPPLVIDTVNVKDPGNYGFTLADDLNAPPAITKVEITGPDTVTITLAAAPVNPNTRLRYAQNQIPMTCIGPGLDHSGGARGNVHDSDATPSHYGYDLVNWSVMFDVALP